MLFTNDNNTQFAFLGNDKKYVLISQELYNILDAIKQYNTKHIFTMLSNNIIILKHLSGITDAFQNDNNDLLRNSIIELYKYVVITSDKTVKRAFQNLLHFIEFSPVASYQLVELFTILSRNYLFLDLELNPEYLYRGKVFVIDENHWVKNILPTQVNSIFITKNKKNQPDVCYDADKAFDNKALKSQLDEIPTIKELKDMSSIV